MGLRKRVEELENEAVSAFHHSIELDDKVEALKDWKETLAATVSVEEVKDWSDPVQVLAARMNRIEQVVRRREKDVAEIQDLLETLKVMAMLGRNHGDLVSVLSSPEKRENVIKEFDAWYEKLTG